MSLARSEAGLAALGGAALLIILLPLLLGVGATPERPSRPIREIVTSNLRDEALSQAFMDRLDHLAPDKDGMAYEFREAGFRVEAFYGGRCWLWVYPVAPGAPDEALRAFAQVCDDEGAINWRRLAIGHQPMTYD